MRHYTTLYLFVCLPFLTMACKEKATTTSTGELTKAFLTNSKWATEMGHGGGLEIKFTDDSVRFDFNMEGSSCGTTKYVLTGNKIQLNATTRCPGVENFIGTYENASQVCELVHDENALQYKNLIRCPNGPSFGQVESLVKKGDTLTHEGRALVSEGLAQGEILSAARFRSAPDATAKTIFFQPGNDIEGSVGPKTDTLPGAQRVILIARTKDKVAVQKWNNYWYYVGVYAATYTQGWVFGEFVK